MNRSALHDHFYKCDDIEACQAWVESVDERTELIDTAKSATGKMRMIGAVNVLLVGIIFYLLKNP